MTWFARLALGLTFWTVAAAPVFGQDRAPAGRTVIEEVTVVSAERETPLTNVTVIIPAERIVAITDSAVAPAPGDVSIDGRGRFLTPGLIDGHVHLTVVPGIPVGPPAERHREMVAAYWEQLPLGYLYFGFTTLVDLASFPEALERFRAAPLRPDFLTCAAMPVVGGYPLVFIQAEDLAYVAERGGNIVFGSDTPADPAKTHVPGYGGFKELRHMQAAGMSPRQILTGATLGIARAFGADDELGTVQPGRIANLLLLARNPHESVEAYDSIEKVILRGRVIDRADLAATAGSSAPRP